MDRDYTFAFQPIFDAVIGRTVSFEALVRGPAVESAAAVMQALDGDALHRFDVQARSRAVQLAADLGLRCRLNLNLMPSSLDRLGADCIESTLDTARCCGIWPQRLVFEITEGEAISDIGRFVENVRHLRTLGARFAIDDFGAGYAGLSLLAEFQPETVKLDRQLVRNIAERGPRQAIVRAVQRACDDLGIDIVAEGVETLAEYDWLRGQGIRLFQGYLLARPGFRSLPPAVLPRRTPQALAA